MKELTSQIRWHFMVMMRNNLIYISIALTVIYAILFYFIKDLPNVERFLVLLIYNDPALIGLFFLGLSVIMEKNESVLPALFVTPINHHWYLISRILVLSFIGWACAAGMTFAMLGATISWGVFSIGVFGTCMVFCLAGIYVVSYTTEFLHFMLRSIPILLLLSLPLLNYFQLTDISLLNYTPVYGPLALIISSFEGPTDFNANLVAFANMIFWIPLLYLVSFRVFVNRMVKAL